MLMPWWYLLFVVLSMGKEMGRVSATSWSCSDGSSSELSFPHFQLQQMNSSLWQDSQLGVSYVYPVPSASRNCSGTVTAIQFCYRLQHHQSSMVHVFTLNILAPLNNFSRLSPSINVTSMPMVGSQPGSGGICYSNRDGGHIYCCDHLRLDTLQTFAFPKEDFVIVICTSPINEARLQMWRHLQAIPYSFVAGSLAEIRRMYNYRRMVGSQTFQVIRLLIGDESGNYNDSANTMLPTPLVPSDVFITSSTSVEEYTSQPQHPSTTIPFVETNFINSAQTSPNNFNPTFTSSTTPYTKNLITSDIEPSSNSTAAIIDSNSKSYSSETLISPMTTSPEDMSVASTLPQYSLFTMPIMNSLVTSDIEPSPHTSTATIIFGNFNAYSSKGILLPTTFPEGLSDTSTPPPNNPSAVMSAPSTPSPNTSSTNRWRCKEGNVTGDNTKEYIFPAIEMEDLRFSLWQDTLQGVSYLYHVNSSEIGCSGTVTEIRFCYRVSLNVSTEEHIFTMRIMSNSRHVLKSVEITSTPTNSSGDSTTINCINEDNNNKKYCCDSMNFATNDAITTFPTSEFILGIETPNSSHIRLQHYRSNVSQGVYNLPMPNIFSEMNKSMKIVATTLPVIRYKIYAPDNFDSASGSSPLSLISSETYTSSSFMEKSSYQEKIPTTIIAFINTNSFYSSQSTASVFIQTSSSSNLNPPFTSSSTMPVPSSTSTAAITKSNLNSYSSKLLFTSFPEGLSDTSILLPTPPSTIMSSPSTPTTNTSSTNRWRCKEVNVTGDNTREYVFPAIEMEDIRFSLWQDTLQGVSYLYHVNSSEIGCSGPVTEIRFCYRVSLNVSTEEHIFTMSIMNSGAHVLKSVEITSTPTNSSGNSTTDNCMNVNDSKYCCDSMNLTGDDAILFSISEFILGIETSNSSQVWLQNFRPNASQGEYNLPTIKMFPETTGRLSTTLLAIRFHIQFSTNYYNPPSENFSTDTTSIVNTSSSMFFSALTSYGSSTLGASMEAPSSTLTTSSKSYKTTTEIPINKMMDEENKKEKSRVALIVGIIVGFLVAALLVLIILIIFFSTKQYSKSRHPVNHINTSGAQNQYDIEMDLQVGNEYAEVGPQTFNSEGVEVAGAAGNAEAYYSTVNSEVPKLRPSEKSNIYLKPAGDMNTLYAQLEEICCDTKDIKQEDVNLGKLIGFGQFGDVFQGILYTGEEDIEVAVKTLKKGSKDIDKIKFLQEATIMGQFKHPNVVTTYGMVGEHENMMLVLEMLKKGDLREYLHSMKSDDNESLSTEIDGHELLSYCRQVASGMVYLSSKAFVHRDLAARNILVSDDRICKIADFGMARDLMDENYYISGGGMIPIKWTAPEAIGYKKYSTASDVWSFGAVMYEIWSVGHKPFETVENNKVLQLVDSGYRLPPPPGCPHAIYSIMMSCWSPEANDRPSFMQVSTQLSVSNSKLLHWSPEDQSLNPKFRQLGADLCYSEKLFTDLQNKYRSKSEGAMP